VPAPKDPEKYEEWCRKLREAKKNFVPWNKGRKYSEEPEFAEYRQKLSAAHKGHSRGKGRKLSVEHRRKLSEARKGRRIGFAAGHKHSEETKEKMSASHTGVELSEKHRQAISKGVSQAVMDGKLDVKSCTFKTGYHFSPKTNDKHYYRSSYELRAYQLLDADPDVALYITEPMVIPYTFKGKAKRYIPDLYIEYTDGSWSIIEVKPLYQLNWPSVQAKVACAQDALRWDYDVWTEAELYA
jgi:hypothetical protein